MENKHTRSVSLIDGHTEEMTDAEIIEALECCSNDGGKNDCLACPNLKTTENWECKEDLPTVALDLINRKNAEIERLQKMQQLIKFEAIKEFAERLCEGKVSNDPVVIAVKTELKMTEVKEN